MPVYEYDCAACGRRSSILFRTFTTVEESPHCRHCDAAALTRVPSRPALIHTGGGTDDGGELRAVDPRRAVESMTRQYDKSGVDPGRAFEEVARRAAAGDSPSTLKEMVSEARTSEAAKDTTSGGS